MSDSLRTSWWKHAPPLPPADAALLAPYDPARPGFEFLVADTCRPGPNINCFREKDGVFVVCLWNIWERDRDPAETDPEARILNDLQRSLGHLSNEVRYVRLQIACLERCYYTFPRNVDLILRGIATGRVDVSEPISCEPPWAWLRRVLAQSAVRSHSEEPRRLEVGPYLAACQAWLFAGSPDALEAGDTARRVYELLGPPTPLKRLYVDMIIVSLLFWTTASELDHEPGWEVLTAHLKVLEGEVRAELGKRADEVTPLVHRINDGGLCHHSFFRRLEHILAHIGAGHAVDFPDKGCERRRIQETVTNYVHALGCWLNGVGADAAIAAWPPAEATIRAVFAALGGPTPVKRWLAACLHKRLRENQARHGCGPIQTDPARFRLSLNLERALLTREP